MRGIAGLAPHARSCAVSLVGIPRGRKEGRHVDVVGCLGTMLVDLVEFVLGVAEGTRVLLLLVLVVLLLLVLVGRGRSGLRSGADAVDAVAV